GNYHESNQHPPFGRPRSRSGTRICDASRTRAASHCTIQVLRNERRRSSSGDWVKMLITSAVFAALSGLVAWSAHKLYRQHHAETAQRVSILLGAVAFMFLAGG